jgi:hypothetical protein
MLTYADRYFGEAIDSHAGGVDLLKLLVYEALSY